jgi:hypothetical protein
VEDDVSGARRTIPVERVRWMWERGYSVPRIVATIGRVDGSRFTAGAVRKVIQEERARDPASFPLRRAPRDPPNDDGISEATQRPLGI